MHISHCHAFCQELKKKNAETLISGSPEYFSLFTSSGTKSFLPYLITSQEQLVLFLTDEHEAKICKVSMLTSSKKNTITQQWQKNHRMQYF